MDERRLMEIWKKNLKEFGDVIRLDSVIILAMREAINESKNNSELIPSKKYSETLLKDLGQK